MTTVGAYEAKTHLPALLAQVEKGETVIITRHGKPIAKLVPADVVRSVAEIFLEMDEIRAQTTTDGSSIRELIDEGRR